MKLKLRILCHLNNNFRPHNSWIFCHTRLGESTMGWGDSKGPQYPEEEEKCSSHGVSNEQSHSMILFSTYVHLGGKLAFFLRLQSRRQMQNFWWLRPQRQSGFTRYALIVRNARRGMCEEQNFGAQSHIACMMQGCDGNMKWFIDM